MQTEQRPAPQLRPLGVGEILDVSLKVVLRNFGTFLGIVALVVIPLGILSTLIQLSILPDGTFVNDGIIYFATQSDANTFGFVRLALGFVALLASFLATGVGVRAVASAYLGQKPSIRESFAYIGRRAHSLLWISFLSLIIVVLGLIALVIPGIYLWVTFIAAVPIVVLEGVKGTKAISRSYNLTQGRWWPTFGAWFVGVFLIPVVLAVATVFVLGLAASGQDLANTTSFVMFENVLSTVASLIATPLQVAVITVLYFDLRVRKEAFDLQLLAERMDGPPTGSPQTLPPAGPPSPSA